MANDGNKSDPSYSLYHSDHPGMVLVSKPLNGDNYSTWRRAITISLNAKSKFGFVDGTLKASSAETKLEDYPTWKKCNDMVFSWILNSLAPDIADNIIFMILLMKFGKIFKIVSFKAMHHAFSNSRKRLLALLKINRRLLPTIQS
ncbi:uncharacterized protein LOC109800316 [Cajanus cajan]|uniref:uncharacterized protein LOC109800316 n=1 Tax=Cajanus cajan TaxID=3821 RepID=UPI0010FAF40C|nr:uncharacterized protein LOC109800316 [Cajanus cajan]